MTFDDFLKAAIPIVGPAAALKLAADSDMEGLKQLLLAKGIITVAELEQVSGENRKAILKGLKQVPRNPFPPPPQGKSRIN